MDRKTDLVNSVDSQIELTVIISIMQGRMPIRTVLAALCRQTYPPARFEVVVVVRGAGAAAGDLLMDGVPPFALRVLTDASGTRGAALNRAAAAATAPLYLFLRDTAVPDPDLVAAHLRAHREQPGIAGMGAVCRRLPPRPAGLVRFMGQRLQARQTALAANPGAVAPLDCDSGNLSVSRAAFLAAGGFAEDLPGGLGQELAYRLQEQGCRCVYLPDAHVVADVATSARRAGAIAARTGRTAWALYRRHPALLPQVALGAFNDTSVRALLLRRLFLALHIPLGLLLDLSRGVPSTEWHRFVYTYCYWHGVRQAVADPDLWARLIRPPVILMYHAIGAGGEPAARYRIPRARFARQMAWLNRRRYPVLPLDTLVRYRQAHRLPPARAVIITFDDGYADNGTAAYPILRRYRFPATIFLVSRAVGGTNSWDKEGELIGRPLLSWAEIRALRDGGVSFGAHSQHHVPLTEVPDATARAEIAGSRTDLEQELGGAVDLFAYPHGKHDARTQAAVAEAGFRGACCSYAGLNDPAVPPFALRRSEVRGNDSLLGFALLPWLGRTRLLPRRPAWRPRWSR